MNFLLIEHTILILYLILVQSRTILTAIIKNELMAINELFRIEEISLKNLKIPVLVRTNIKYTDFNLSENGIEY